MSLTYAQTGRRCSCGGMPGPTGECAACRAKRLARERAAAGRNGVRVSKPGDRDEREATRVADTVMHAPEPTQATRLAGGSVGTGGTPLPRSTRRFFEPRLGHDLSGVRVHADGPAAASARALGARAFTTGANIVFGKAEYAPATRAGQRLLAHELAHVVQQRERPALRSTIQRDITLTDPGGEVVHPPGAMGPWPTKAFELDGWLDTLCPEGNWDVNATTGVVSSADRATFCGAKPTKGHAHHTTGAHPTSCGCLCDLTAAGSKKVEVQIDENLTVGGTSTPLIPLGEAATSHTSATEKVSAFTGRAQGIAGAGATTPLAGAGRAQTIPSPAWLIFGHEVCGHARLQAGGMPPTFIGHATTPEGTQTTVDVENRIRREHSTIAASLGIRGGAFRAKTGGAFANHSGAVYRVAAGETLSKIATRCGIAVASMLTHIWRSDGSEITAADKDKLAAGEELLVEGIDWHEVIAGETMDSIAKIWNIPLASLKRANPQVTGPSFSIHVGDRLMIPAT